MVSRIRVIRFIFLFFFFVVSSYSAPVKSLYNEKDDVISLKDDNFDYTVLATSNAWLIEFYNSWCGHCINYAPFYKRLATEIKGWGPYVKVAAVDCSQDYNRALCQFFDIKMFPTLEFFPAFASKRMNGTSCAGYDTMKILKAAIVDYISNSSLSYIGGRRRDLLRPVENFSDIWQPLKRGYQTTVVIFEEQQSVLGRQAILDTFGQMTLVVRRMLAGNASKYGISKFPSMHLVNNSDGSLKQLAVGDDYLNYVKILKNLISSYLSTKSGAAVVTSRPVGDHKTSRGNASDIRDREIANEIGFSKTTESEWDSDAVLRQRGLNLLSDYYLKVHEQDLESSLHYSFRHEVAMFKTISDEPLIALKKYIQILAKFLPIQRPISLFLNKFSSWLQNKPGPITGGDWLEAINHLQSPTALLPETTIWTGCQGSQTNYRGYPCSLWTTFHTLTVAAYDRTIEKHDQIDDKDVYDSDAKEVLLAIRGYVKFFFGCRECSQNFMKRAANIEELVNCTKSGVLFLWKAHNGANHFLSGDLTEDPAHPKVQFPTPDQCPLCHTSNGKDKSDGDFNKKEVLVFLQKMYSKRNLVPDSPRLKIDTAERNSNDLDGSFHQKHKREDLRLEGSDRNKESAVGDEINYRTRLKEISQAGMGTVDIGMCVIFYVVCLGFIIIVYLRFVKTRSLRLFNHSCRLPI